MKKFFLPLVGLLLVAPAVAQPTVVPSTTQSTPIVGTVAGPLIIAQGQVGQSVYVTHVTIMPSVTAAVTFTQGTGAGCGTGTSNVTGTMTFSAGQFLNVGSGNGALWALLSGNSLCVTIATAVAPGVISWTRF
jgi:hypothetical protein